MDVLNKADMTSRSEVLNTLWATTTNPGRVSSRVSYHSRAKLTVDTTITTDELSSRIPRGADKYVYLPTGVSCKLARRKVSGNMENSEQFSVSMIIDVTVTGPLGTLHCVVGWPYVVRQISTSSGVAVQIVPFVKRLSTKERAMWKTYKAQLEQLITGVSRGFEKRLRLSGVGYRGWLEDGNINIRCGKSHVEQVPIPEQLVVQMPKPTLISILGVNYIEVNQFACQLLRIRPTEPYKGKGIRLFGHTQKLLKGKKDSK